jgi:tRNA 2-thiocytidine biosynthesis protein TtcA
MNFDSSVAHADGGPWRRKFPAQLGFVARVPPAQPGKILLMDESRETKIASPIAERTGPRDPRKAEFETNKLKRRLRRQVGQAIADYAMIEKGDRVMVCLSGGKDSYGLLEILRTLRDKAPVAFEIVAVNLDQKQPGFPADVLPRYLSERGIAFRIAEQDTYSVVKRLIPEGATMCSLCSRLRRGVLYRVAGELGATKIALGHHRDDLLATFFLNLFFGGKMKTMPPKLVSDNGRHVVIRPLAYVRERDLARFAEVMQFPLIPCTLCGSQENLQRKQVSLMLRDWERKYPGRVESIYNALGKVETTHLMDRRIHDFLAVRATGRPEPDGDIAFDVDAVLERATEMAVNGALSQPPDAPMIAAEADIPSSASAAFASTLTRA